MTWRTATPADGPALRRMMHALYVEDPSSVAMTDDKIERTIATLARDPVRGVAVVLDESDEADAQHAPPSASTPPAPHAPPVPPVPHAPHAAGYALLCSFWSNELGGEVCILDELYVAAAARGRGAATSLVSGLLARTTPWFRDAVAVELEVTPGNARARALYERLGFAPLKNAVMRAIV